MCLYLFRLNNLFIIALLLMFYSDYKSFLQKECFRFHRIMHTLLFNVLVSLLFLRCLSIKKVFFLVLIVFKILKKNEPFICLTNFTGECLFFPRINFNFLLKIYICTFSRIDNFFFFNSLKNTLILYLLPRSLQ